MPDHVHLLVAGTSADSAFLSFMTLMRQRTTLAYRALRDALLWQDGYFDRVLNPVEDTRDTVDYIRLNPVKAGLVNRPEDYPFTFLPEPARKSAELYRK